METPGALPPSPRPRNLRPLISFAMGIAVGAAIVFGIVHAPKIGGLFRSPEEVMQANASGPWHGTLNVNGNDFDFTLVVKSDGKSLSGVLNQERVGDVPCDKLEIDASGNISFSAHVEDKAVSFTGKLAPDTQSMAGNLSGDFGDGTWSLAKNKS